MPISLDGTDVEDIYQFSKDLDVPQIHLREPFRIGRPEQAEPVLVLI